MPDLLDRIRVEIRERLDASRAAVEESERLQRALDALENNTSAVASSAASAGAPRPRGRTRRRRSNAAVSRENNRETLIAAVRAQAGMTRDQVREATGLSAATVAQGLRRLVDNGLIVKTDGANGGSPTYAVSTGNAATALRGAASTASASVDTAGSQYSGEPGTASDPKTPATGTGHEPPKERTAAADRTNASGPSDVSAEDSAKREVKRRAPRTRKAKESAARTTSKRSKTSSAKPSTKAATRQKAADPEPRRATSKRARAAAKPETSPRDGGAANPAQQFAPEAQ